MKTFLAALFLALGVILATAQTNSVQATPLKFSVLVSVGGGGTNEMASYLKRELRGLHDVEVKDKDAGGELSVVVTSLHNGSVYIAGWAACSIEKDKRVLVVHGVEVADSLRRLAEKVATQFDSVALEPSRQMGPSSN